MGDLEMSISITALEQHLSECLSRQSTLQAQLREVEMDISHLRLSISRAISASRDPHVTNPEGEP